MELFGKRGATMKADYTKRAFTEALYELLKMNSLDRITVKSICDTCGFSKKTFYYYFKDKYDLAVYWYNKMNTEAMRLIGIRDYLSELAAGNPNLCDIGSRTPDIMVSTVNCWHVTVPPVISKNLLIYSEDENCPHQVRLRTSLNGRKIAIEKKLAERGLALDPYHTELAAEIMWAISQKFCDRWLPPIQENTVRNEAKILVEINNSVIDFFGSHYASSAKK